MQDFSIHSMRLTRSIMGQRADQNDVKAITENDKVASANPRSGGHDPFATHPSMSAGC